MLYCDRPPVGVFSCRFELTVCCRLSKFYPPRVCIILSDSMDSFVNERVFIRIHSRRGPLSQFTKRLCLKAWHISFYHESCERIYPAWRLNLCSFTFPARSGSHHERTHPRKRSSPWFHVKVLSSSLWHSHTVLSEICNPVISTSSGHIVDGGEIHILKTKRYINRLALVIVLQTPDSRLHLLGIIISFYSCLCTEIWSSSLRQLQTICILPVQNLLAVPTLLYT
jgi:hypothetical protein